MLIEIHMIQNHSPANLNRDDLGAPKTCIFGGALRSRISSQCIKRSIRFSPEFTELRGGIRTRRLAEKLYEQLSKEDIKTAEKILGAYSLIKKGKKSKKEDSDEDAFNEESEVLIFTTYKGIKRMVEMIADPELTYDDKVKRFNDLLTKCVHSPDMALSGRMLEAKGLKDTKVEAALQVAHAISTHIARPEIDYFVAADDIPGEDAGAGHIGESMFTSACFYKYFSLDWDQLKRNLNGDENLAAHTVGAFIKAAASSNPSGKQNSFAAHNFPDGILVEFSKIPISYANAFVKPIYFEKGTDIVEQSIGQLANYVEDFVTGYCDDPSSRISFWFSPNGRHELNIKSKNFAPQHVDNLGELVSKVLDQLGNFDWDEVRQAKVYLGD
ncbi:MAG: type I-E CRISPR-associated protein Cas7/Cse4/CasC [Candidatus Cloacimonetes bacterium]|nr:type I-E CRISPR-associated protein Cas7/Cse4/CasC [Candidatus Cloacimonadota bacterium]NLO12100.1 type I-E CRISPR-associated protein Cas7/Cse4/CasC [Candidatus Cloacimonadota bacterium]